MTYTQAKECINELGRVEIDPGIWKQGKLIMEEYMSKYPMKPKAEE